MSRKKAFFIDRLTGHNSVNKKFGTTISTAQKNGMNSRVYSLTEAGQSFKSFSFCDRFNLYSFLLTNVQTIMKFCAQRQTIQVKQHL